MRETDLERFERYSSKGQNNDDNKSDGTHDNWSQHTPHSGPGHFERQRVGAATGCTCDAERHGTASNVPLRSPQTSPHATLGTLTVFELLGALATDLPNIDTGFAPITRLRSLNRLQAPEPLGDSPRNRIGTREASTSGRGPFTSRPHEERR